MKNLRKSMQVKYQNVDEILYDTEALLDHSGVQQDKWTKTLSSPIMFELSDPMARFSCIPKLREFSTANAISESLYLLSGMNGYDLVKEFRFQEGSKGNEKYRLDKGALGPPLRFLGQKNFEILGHQEANSLRRTASGYTDQLAEAVEILTKKNKSPVKAVIQFASIQNPLLVHSAWFYSFHGKLEMMVSAEIVDNPLQLYHDILSPFAFLHQIVSELTDIPLGGSRFIIGCLYSSAFTTPFKITKAPTVDMYNFRYPNGKLHLRDIDTLISIMVEFVSRLDENTLNRANPFEGDNRVQMWSDYAEVFRSWKAKKLEIEITMRQNFFHPQLRFIYKGEAV